MSTSTRLILLLTLMVGAVMLIGGYLRLRQREAILVTAMHNEVRAHASTLRIALEEEDGAKDPKDADGHFQLGRALIQAGEKEEGMRELERARVLNNKKRASEALPPKTPTP